MAMDIFIKPEIVNSDTSQNLDEIGNWLSDDLHREITRHTEPSREGEKDGFLLIGLAIINVAFAAVNTTINVINYWASKNTGSSVTLKNGSMTISLGGLS